MRHSAPLIILRLVIAILLSPWANAQNIDSFEVFLFDYQNAKNLSEEKGDEVIDKWVEVKTWDGFDLVVGDLLKGNSGERRVNCFRILRKMKLPPDEMVSRLLANADSALEELDRFPPYLSVLEQFRDDDRIIEWLATRMSDRRRVPSPKRKMFDDAAVGESVRVCDCAAGTISRMLIKRKQLPSGGLGVGDPSLEYRNSDRDVFIAALAKKLIELGFDVKEPTSKPREQLDPRIRKDRLENLSGKKFPSQMKSIADGTSGVNENVDRTWMIWLVGGCLVALIAFVVIRFIGRGHP